MRRHPGLLAERLGPRPGAKRWDVAVSGLAGILQLGVLVVAGLWITMLRRKVQERSAALEAQVRERQKAEQARRQALETSLRHSLAKLLAASAAVAALSYYAGRALF